ncbi:MAG: hypothetical protein KDK01_01365 [Rhodobacteraceae bacterium]|jgi:uncharacterized membrane protein|nr:hypothetical protein [Paracoccaceae bacterium]
MGYLILVLGVLAWSGGHLFKRLAPARRAAMGDAGKGLVSILSLVGIVLMVLGYRWAPVDDIWPRNPGMVHVNNTLMLLAFYLFAASGMKTGVTRFVRHPQLWGVRLWALGHILVNGDLASFILFGGLFAWAQASALLINRDVPDWTRNPPAPVGKEIGAVVGAVVVMGAVGWIHSLVGPWPFG